MRPVLFLFLAACESGLASVVDVEVSDAVATARGSNRFPRPGTPPPSARSRPLPTAA